MPARPIRKKRVWGADREEVLKLRESPEGTEYRIWNRVQSYKSRLVIPLKGFRPAKMNWKRRRRKSNIPPPKVAKGIERRGRRRGQVRDTQHGQKSKRKGHMIEGMQGKWGSRMEKTNFRYSLGFGCTNKPVRIVVYDSKGIHFFFNELFAWCFFPWFIYDDRV
jgi:hypothetical protein